MNKPDRHKNIIDISSFRNGLNQQFSSYDFNFKSKIVEGSYEV